VVNGLVGETFDNKAAARGMAPELALRERREKPVVRDGRSMGSGGRPVCGWAAEKRA